MTNFFGSQSKAASRTRPTPAAALRIQSSVNGLPRPFGWGQARLAGNLIWYGNFTPIFVPDQGGGAGKNVGGGGTTTGGGSYSYTTGAAWGICEGPIDAVLQAWQSKSPIVPATEGFAVFDGDYQQNPWPWLLAFQSDAAQSFRGIAYAGVSALDLGSSQELPNMTWETRFAIAGALSETLTVPGSPYKVTPSYFDWDYGVAGHYVIPAATPYVVLPDRSAFPIERSAIAAAIESNDVAWFNSDSSGVIWDVGATNGTPGQPLTKVGGAPGPGQYNFAGAVGWTFNAADADQPIVIVGAALAPGVYYAAQITGDLTAGNTLVTNLSDAAAIVPGSHISGAGVPLGTFVTVITGGTAMGDVASGSATIANVSGSFTAAAGTPITDAAGAIPPGTTVSAVTLPSITAAFAAARSGTGVAFNSVVGATGDLAFNQIANLSSTAGIVVGAVVADVNGQVGGGPTVTAVVGTTVTLSFDTSNQYQGDSFTFTTQFTGDVTQGSATIANPSSLALTSTASVLTDSIGAFPAGTGVSAVTQGSIALSHNATASVAGDALRFAAQATLSQPATATGTAVALTVRGAALAQVMSAPAKGQFSLSVQAGHFGEYSFAAADSGASVTIMDTPDANPADVLFDFLTNPYYGMTQFAPDRIGDLAVYRDYCRAAGLLVSPTITTQGAANQFLQDLMSATNSELVWSGGKLTAVPYGDVALNANGATYTPAAAPIYAFDDDDLLPNQGTNPASISGTGSDDPVTVTRLDPADQDNDIKVEYLDRANLYNPTIVEAKDDAAIALFGLKNSGSKQLHLFCDQGAALASAQLMLGRQQVRRSFSFTIGREFILLDPMDIVAVTDAGAGLADQWVRIKEITENDDRSLSIVAEEYLQGTGSAPEYGHARPAGYVQNYNLPAPDALTPVMFDAPVQINNVLGMETILATNGSGPNWGGCEVWISSDNVTFNYAGALYGGTAMGTLTANFASGSDPDTANTLAVDLSATKATLTGGTMADADQGHTLALVEGELVTYQQATLTGQCRYDLGKHGATAGYLRRGFYGTTIAAHSSGASFVRLRSGTYFTLGYDASDIGQTVYVKLLSFNPWGGGKQTLDQVSSHAHVLAAPPAVSSGLLSGVIQTPDMALQAATAQLTVQAAGPVTVALTPANATLVSGTLTTAGHLVQVAYNAQFTNTDTTNPATVVWRLTYQGVTVLDSAAIVIQPGASATIAKQTTYTPGAMAGLFALIADYLAGPTSAPTASFIDMSVTEIKR